MAILDLPEQLFNDLTTDLQTALKLDGELFAEKFTPKEYLRHKRDSVEINIYSEPVSRRELFENPVDVIFKIQLEPEQDELNKWGMQTSRDALCVFSRYLMDLKYRFAPKIGDRFNWNDIQYEIRDVRETDEWRDSGYFFHYICGASRVTKAPYPIPDDRT